MTGAEIAAAQAKLLVGEDHVRAVQDLTTRQLPYYLDATVTASSISKMMIYSTRFKRGSSLSVELNNYLKELHSDAPNSPRMRKLWREVGTSKDAVKLFDDRKKAFQAQIPNLSVSDTLEEARNVQDQYLENHRLVKMSVASKKMSAQKLKEYLKALQAK